MRSCGDQGQAGLEALAEPQDVSVTVGTLALQVSLPLPSVSLLVLTPR